jgi:hypothetical protein
MEDAKKEYAIVLSKYSQLHPSASFLADQTESLLSLAAQMREELGRKKTRVEEFACWAMMDVRRQTGE